MLSALAAALGLPLIAVIGNAFTRWLANLPQSAPADMVLAFLVFDVLVVLQGEDFAHFVRDETLRSNLPAIYAMLIMIGTFAWAISVFVVEDRMARYYRSRIQPFPHVPFFLSLFLPVISFFGSVVPFVYEG